MHDYYYRDQNETGEVIIQAVDTRLSVRTTEDDGQTTALIYLPAEEIDRMIAGLRAAKQKILTHMAVHHDDHSDNVSWTEGGSPTADRYARMPTGREE